MTAMDTPAQQERAPSVASLSRSSIESDREDSESLQTPSIKSTEEVHAAPVAQKDTQAVHLSKILVYVVLTCAAIAVGTFLHRFLTVANENDFVVKVRSRACGGSTGARTV
jgi:hypothetical protein